jgi:transcriptional regulator with XRE-family HTH domain
MSKTPHIIESTETAGSNRHLSLAVLRVRQKLTQVQMAKKIKMSQSDVSRAEQREDCLVSTLDRYAKGLGGKLRLVIEIKGQAYTIGLQSSPRR